MKVLLMVFGVVAKLGPLLKFKWLLALVPGGQIVGIVGGILSAVATLIRWFWKGVEDCFAHPAAFIVCLVFMLGGAYGMAKWDHQRVNEARQEVASIKQQWAKKDKDDAIKAAAAATARAKAEAEASAAPAPAAVQPKRVRAKQSPAKPKDQPGLFSGLFANPK